MICPFCKADLEYKTTKTKGSIEVQLFECLICKDDFERHVIFNSIGLVKYDELFRITEGGFLQDVF